MDMYDARTVTCKPEALAKYDGPDEVMWEFENHDGEIMQLTIDKIAKRIRYELIDFDEEQQDWITVKRLTKTEANTYWDLPRKLYS
jgi:hypothetical protein